MSTKASHSIVFAILAGATAIIALTFETRWFILSSLSVPMVSAGAALFTCSHSRMSRQRTWLQVSSAFTIPAVCSWIYWNKLLYSFST